MAVRRPQRRGPTVVLLEQPVEALPARVGQLELLVVPVEDLDLLELVAEQDVLELGLALDVAVLLSPGQPVQRRLGDVHVAGLDQRLHLAEQQRQRERADVSAVDVGVGQQHDLVVASLGDVELVAHAGADRGDQRLDLGVGQDLVDAALLDVQDLPAQRQDRLRVAVAGAHGRAAGRVALDDEQLRERRVLDRAVGELAGQGRVLERRLASGQVARLARGRPGPRRVDALADHARGRPAGSPRGTPIGARTRPSCTKPCHAGVAELGLGLALELRIGQLGRDHRGQALADVLAGQVRRPCP